MATWPSPRNWPRGLSVEMVSNGDLPVSEHGLLPASAMRHLWSMGATVPTFSFVSDADPKGLELGPGGEASWDLLVHLPPYGRHVDVHVWMVANAASFTPPQGGPSTLGRLVTAILSVRAVEADIVQDIVFVGLDGSPVVYPSSIYSARLADVGGGGSPEWQKVTIRLSNQLGNVPIFVLSLGVSFPHNALIEQDDEDV
jgi:hypothetical protein